MKKRKLSKNFIILFLTAFVLMLWGSVSFFAEPEYEDVYPEESYTEITDFTDEVSTSEVLQPTTLLPEANELDIEYPDVIGETDSKDEPKLAGGFVMWICVGVMVAVILAIILTSKTKAYRGGGKKRYSTGNKMGSGPHLLGDKYYHKRK